LQLAIWVLFQRKLFVGGKLKDYKTENLRNVAMGAHGGAGKTSLVEALLYDMGETTRLGVVDQGNTVSDFNDEEIERQISISASLLHGEWNQTKINIIDTPGYSDFFGEVVGAFRAVDNVIVMISASGGIEVGTEMVWEESAKQNLPRIIVINKLDKENINFDKLLAIVQESFGHKVVLAQFPVETGPNFSSLVDLIRMKVLKFKTDSSGAYGEEEIPADLQTKAADLRIKLIEAVAESDDALMEKYLKMNSQADSKRPLAMMGFILCFVRRPL
jgi:elongation factor G